MTDTNDTNDTELLIKEYLNEFYRPATDALASLRAEAEAEMVPIILRPTESLLGLLMDLKKPASVLEIGAAIGYSACFFARMGAERVVTLERDGQACQRAAGNVKAMGFADRITVMEGDALESLKALREANDSFDMLFIDASKSHYREFWDAAVPMMRDGGLIICDNVMMRGLTAAGAENVRRKHRTSTRNMREFLSFICGLTYGRTYLTAEGDGAAVTLFDRAAFEKESHNL